MEFGHPAALDYINVCIYIYIYIDVYMGVHKGLIEVM